MPGTGLGGEVLGAFLFVVVGLRQGGVQLVRAGGAHAFILVVNVRRRIQRLFQAAGAEERRGTPLRIKLPHFAGNLDLALLAHFLQNQTHGKQRRQVVGTERLQGSWMQRRRHRRGQIGGNVVPGKRNAILRQVVLDGFHAQILTAERAGAALPTPKISLRAPPLPTQSVGKSSTFSPMRQPAHNR